MLDFHLHVDNINQDTKNSEQHLFECIKIFLVINKSTGQINKLNQVYIL